MQRRVSKARQGYGTRMDDGRVHVPTSASANEKKRIDITGINSTESHLTTNLGASRWVRKHHHYDTLPSSLLLLLPLFLPILKVVVCHVMRIFLLISQRAETKAEAAQLPIFDSASLSTYIVGVQRQERAVGAQRRASLSFIGWPPPAIAIS